MLKVGDQLPEFVSVNQDGETVNSQDLLGKKLVIFFYPKANTPGCTAEACDLNDNISILKTEGYQLLGVSADPVKNQKKLSDIKSKDMSIKNTDKMFTTSNAVSSLFGPGTTAYSSKDRARFSDEIRKYDKN